MNSAEEAYDVFNRLWANIPRSVRLDRKNNQLMLDLRRFFDGLLEASKRAAIVGNVVGAANAAANKPASALGTEIDEQPDPVRQALRLLRTLDRREWEMVRSIVDLFHKFSTEDLLDVLDAARDASCPHCGDWLDDDDPHENCPSAPDEEEEESESAEADAATVSAEADAATVSAAPVVAPPSQVLAESESKVGPRE